MVRARTMGWSGFWHDLVLKLQHRSERVHSPQVEAQARSLGEEADLSRFLFTFRDSDRDALRKICFEHGCPLDREADAVLSGRLLDVEGPAPRAPYPWERDPLTQEPVRGWDSGPESRLRPLLEAGRLPAVTLGLARAELDQDLGLREQMLDLLAHFFSRNPYAHGVHWYFPETVALRLLQLVWVRALVGPRILEARFGPEFAAQIFLHQEYLDRFQSHYPTWDWRKITLAAAQFVAGLSMPWFPESRRWRDDGITLFESEILAQTTPDGVGTEQNHSIEFRNLELCMLVLRLAETWDFDLRPVFVDRVQKMGEYFVSWHHSRDPATSSGEIDPRRAFSLPLGHNHRSRSLMAVMGVHFEREEWARLAGGLDPQSIYLLGDRDELERFQDWVGDTQVHAFLPEETFPQGGRFFFRSSRQPSMTLGFDAGNHGGDPLCELAHADALGITLEIDGLPVICDSGSTYRQDKGLTREYFRSTGAHNTLRADWTDSSVPGPGGLWLKVHEVEDLGYAQDQNRRLLMASACHRGFSRGNHRLVHRRMVSRDGGDSQHFAIEDRLECEDPSQSVEVLYELLFHMHPNIPQIQIQRGLYQIPYGGGVVCMRFNTDNDLKVQATYGNPDPLLGWSARQGAEVEKCWVLRVYGTDRTPIVLRTAIFPG